MHLRLFTILIYTSMVLTEPIIKRRLLGLDGTMVIDTSVGDTVLDRIYE